MNRRAIGLGLLILAALVLFATRQAPTPTHPAGCEPHRRDAIVRGLSYAEGFRAGLISTQADSETIAMADRNVAATVATIERCGW